MYIEMFFLFCDTYLVELLYIFQGLLFVLLLISYFPMFYSSSVKLISILGPHQADDRKF